ncbi:MAG: hypothetical protein A07HR60_02405 [uncultured archaeon A07HR60]|nr:MAG: hypothetical protein A07HR60_02405 [uncultured archaeon A07HR60]
MTVETPRCGYEYQHLLDADPDTRVDISRPAPSQCPHPVVDAAEGQCLFHLMDDDYPVSEATEAFLDALDSESRSSSFAGAYLPGLELADEVIATADKQPLDLRGSIIDGDIDLTGSLIEVPVLLDGASVTGEFLAEDATFEAPVSLVGTIVRGGMHWQAADIAGGVVANELDAGYLDWRGVTVDGPIVFDSAAFASSLKLARGEVSDDLSLAETTFDWHIDATKLTVGGDIALSGLTADGNIDFVGTDVDGDADMRKLEVGGDAEWDHTSIGGELLASDCSIDGKAGFDDAQIRGGACVFDGAEIGEKADFASVAVPEGRFSAMEAVFHGEVWFTHAVIEGMTDLSRAVFNGATHLRDADFCADVSLRGVEGTGQTWMAGSTITGQFDCSGAEFDYFQFSATVHGDADFERTEFIDKTVFTSSTFHGRVWFDEASFAGSPDFSKTRFTNQVSFDDTEFLVEPVFEAARFASRPDFTVAEFPTDVDVDPEDRERRWQLVLVHPESLVNNGYALPIEELTGEFVVPAGVSHLVNDRLSRTKAVNAALSELEQGRWGDLVDNSLRTARTAVTQLDETEMMTLVFGVTVDTDGDFATGFFKDIVVAGVYERSSGTVVFGHLHPDLTAVDYLIPIPAIDKAFDAGAAVATRAELRKAMLRHERFRLAQLGEGGDDGERIHNAVVPVLVAAGQTSDS